MNYYPAQCLNFTFDDVSIKALNRCSNMQPSPLLHSQIILTVILFSSMADFINSLKIKFSVLSFSKVASFTTKVTIVTAISVVSEHAGLLPSFSSLISPFLSFFSAL